MTKKHNLEKETTALQVISTGVRVRIRVDGDGRPLYSIPVYDPEDPQDERFVELAVKAAHNAASAAAQHKLRKDSSAGAADQSAKNRRKDVEEHWTNEWLGNAYREDPTRGRTRLAQRARRLASDAGIELDKREQITDERARQFLSRQKSGGRANAQPPVSRSRP